MSNQNHQNQNNIFMQGLAGSMGRLAGSMGSLGSQAAGVNGYNQAQDPLANIRAIPDKLADKIRAARVAARNAYCLGNITREQYEAQNNLLNDLVRIQIDWYKAYIRNFDELSFVGASGDGGAVF